MLLTLAALACDSDPNTDPDEADRCELGQSRHCVDEAGCDGERRCGGSPRRFGACICEEPPPAQTDGGEKPALGGACVRDAQCPAPAFCLVAPSDALFGGAPPVGTCVAACERGRSCERFARAVCVDAGEGDDLCFESCTVGSSASAKCHERPHVACAPLPDASMPEQSDSTGYCRPLCAVDADCDAGRSCDPARGVCVADPVSDPEFGLRCQNAGAPDDDADAGAPGDAGTGSSGVVDSCTGLCVQLNETPEQCSRACVFGSADECGPASGGLRRGACVFVTPGGGISDLGYCAELCDCNDDCIEPTFVCDELDETLRKVFGRGGVCTDPALVLARELACEK